MVFIPSTGLLKNSRPIEIDMTTFYAKTLKSISLTTTLFLDADNKNLFHHRPPPAQKSQVHGLEASASENIYG